MSEPEDAETTRSALVVEDDALQAMDLAETLTAIEIRVIGPFARSAEALAALRTETPSFALLDVELSDGDCLPVADVLAARGAPFAFLSGRDDHVPAWLDRYGDRILLPKPYRPSQIANLIARLVGDGSAKTADGT